MRDNASLTRPAFIEADLAQIFETEDLASFALLWLLMHRSRFGPAGAPAADCALERWREAGARAGEAARERLAGQVEQALKELGSGFLAANRELREKLAAQEIGLTEWFNELLRLVYRLIFLMVAEDRNLLHPPGAGAEERRLYAEGYSLTMLRAQAARRSAWDRHHDRYEGLKIVFRALAGGERRLGLPALGGLFAPGLLPTLEGARLPNRALLSAIYRLGWLSDGAGVAPVNWQAMQTEELGSVYESLLELQPQLAEEGRCLVFAAEAAEARGNQRKTTGSYYTPDSLVQALLDSALDPVLDRAEAGAEDPAEALLNLTVLDPACGSGHFLLAAARRIATRVARHRAGGTPSAEDFRHALRDVARRCLHGVDRNPMAVELTKVALWIETVDPGLPLGFFDAQIRCGDSLLGVFDLKALEKGIPDGAYKPLAGDDRETARHFAARNRDERAGQGSLDFARGGGALPAARQFATLGSRLRALREDTPEQVAERARLFAALRSGPEWYAWKVACDAYVAAFLAPKTGGVPANRNTVTIPTTAHVWEAMAGRMPYGPLVGRAVALAEAARAFHWPLEFPDVMAKGGFDVVLGNPPWERIKLQEQEFFAARAPEIAAAPNKAARERLIRALAQAPEGSKGRALHAAFLAAKREAEAVSAFARTPGEEGGRFPLTGRGDINTYALFAELFSRLAAPGGRAGVIVPTGIATDATTAPFFAAMVEGSGWRGWWISRTQPRSSLASTGASSSASSPSAGRSRWRASPSSSPIPRNWPSRSGTSPLRRSRSRGSTPTPAPRRCSAAGRMPNSRPRSTPACRCWWTRRRARPAILGASPSWRCFTCPTTAPCSAPPRSCGRRASCGRDATGWPRGCAPVRACWRRRAAARACSACRAAARARRGAMCRSMKPR